MVTAVSLLKNFKLRTLCLPIILLLLFLFYLTHIHVHKHSNSRLQLSNTVEDGVYKYNTSLGSARVNSTRFYGGVEPTLSSNNLPLIITENCKSRICKEFLTKKDLEHFEYCWRKSGLKREVERSQCRFINGTGRSPVALASFPGSGNTWVRGLLQEVTGICTGGIYCDTTLRISGYPGETLRGGNTLVVKAHHVDPRWTGVYYPPNATYTYFDRVSKIPIFEAAIFLIRNPFNALVAEWNRCMTEDQVDNHVQTVDESFFMNNSDWNKWVHTNALIWQDTLSGWLINNHDHGVMVVKYEDLQKNVNSKVTKMLDFLGFPYSLTVVNKILANNYDEFHRKHSNSTSFEHFTNEQKQFIYSVIQNTINILESHKMIAICDIKDYLQPL